MLLYHSRSESDENLRRKSIRTCASAFGLTDCDLQSSIEARNLESPILIISRSVLVKDAMHGPMVTR
jgi:hypothetical protein